jgi:hypothetical protein
MELGSGGVAAHVFSPGNFAGILTEMGPANMVVLADLRASQNLLSALPLIRRALILLAYADGAHQLATFRYRPTLFCMMPPSAKMVVAVR